MLCFACGNYNIVLVCHIYTHIHMCTHTHTHTHTQTHTNTNTHTDLNLAILGKIVELNTQAIETMLVCEI